MSRKAYGVVRETERTQLSPYYRRASKTLCVVTYRAIDRDYIGKEVSCSYSLWSFFL